MAASLLIPGPKGQNTVSMIIYQSLLSIKISDCYIYLLLIILMVVLLVVRGILLFVSHDLDSSYNFHYLFSLIK